MTPTRRPTVTATAWDDLLVDFVRRLDAPSTADALCAGVPLARRYGLPRGRSLESTWGAAVRPIVGSSASVFGRIAAHPAADHSVWIALLRAHHSAAEDALTGIDAPHRNAAYRAGALRFSSLDQRLLLRAAEHAHGEEFARFARRVVERARWLAGFNAPHVERLLDQFAAAATTQIAAAPRTLWRPLLHVADAGVRLRAIRMARMGRLA